MRKLVFMCTLSLAGILFQFNLNLQSQTGEEPFANYKYHLPFEILKIMSDSPVKYDISIDTSSNFNYLVLNRENFKMFSISPLYNLKKNSDGSIELIEDTPTDTISRLLDTAEQKFAAKEYYKAMEYYEKIIKLDSGWFKGWSYLGDAYYFLGEYDKAEFYFLKAISLNEIGYQEYFYLSDNNYKRGDFKKSLDYIIKAFMLNRSSKSIKSAIDRILPKLKLQYRENRLSFPIKIEKISDKECNIICWKKDSSNYVALANCLAAWEMEKEFYENYNKDSINGLLCKYKECLMNQAIITEQLIKDKKYVSKVELSLFNVVNDGYLDAMIYWDIFALKYPINTLLLPKNMKEKICEYIKKYCFEDINN